jgi:hypothetical protein
LELTPHAVELLDVPRSNCQMRPNSRVKPSQALPPPGANQVLCLDLASTHLALLRALADLGDKRLLLLLKLHTLLIELADRLVEEALVLAQALGRRDALAEGPF